MVPEMKHVLCGNHAELVGRVEWPVSLGRGGWDHLSTNCQARPYGLAKKSSSPLWPSKKEGGL